MKTIKDNILQMLNVKIFVHSKYLNTSIFLIKYQLKEKRRKGRKNKKKNTRI